MPRNKMRAELVAPCGMNCNVCSGYLAYSHNIPKKRGKIVHCEGCRPRDKMCAFLKGQCSKLRNKEIEYCFECDTFPCDHLQKIDARYRKNYNASFIENLEEIRKSGVAKFLKNQEKIYECPKCKGTLSIHNRKCYDCEKIESWKP